MAALARLVERSQGMDRTLHRVIDIVPDPIKALDQVVLLGFDRVLTSGAKPFAPRGCRPDCAHGQAGRTDSSR